jgi:hypothetical protein
LTPPHNPHSRIDAYFAWLWRRYRWVLGMALVLGGISGWAAAHLKLRTDFAELLPSRDPAVAELRRINSQVGGLEVLNLFIESPDREANLRVSQALVAELRRLPPRLVRTVAFDVRDERTFFKDNGWLFIDLDTLKGLRDALRGRIESRKNPLFVDLDDSGEKPEAVIERIKARARELDKYPTGYFEGEEGRAMVIVVRPPGGVFGEHVGEELARRVHEIIATLAPQRFHPQMKVSLTGPVMAALEEREALENDLVMATVVCLVLVIASVVIFYGRLRAVLLVGIPALVGVAVAFGCAEVLFGYLNSSTAFMGSIVVGNGINFAIIQLARYEEERRAGASPREASSVALRTTLRPTVMAALGASVAYASLCVTRFRGFSQFGVIGGIGMVAAWGATVTLLPPLCRAFDSDRHTQRRLPGRGGGQITALVGRVATRWPGQILVGSLVLTALAIVPFFSYVKDPFEYDFANLRNRRAAEGGSATIRPRVEKIFGRALIPAVIVAERREQTEEIRRAILERDRPRPGEARGIIGEVHTIEDFLPGSLAVQREKLAVLAELRKLIDDPALRLLDDADRRKLLELRPSETLRPLTEKDLPESVRATFTELDGTVGRIVLVYHRLEFSGWDGRNLMRIADIIGAIPLHDGTLVRTSGHAVVFAAMIRSITHDAPIATVVSLCGVLLLVVGLTRVRGGASLVMAVLCAGVAWMLGAAAWAGVRTNFLNFIALPITFGIGVDYGINIYMRYCMEGPGHVERAVQATGGAVALCSLTTIIGYGVLLVADNQGLRSFGEMAILGEIACLAAAVMVMPAFLVWREKRRRPHRF